MGNPTKSRNPRHTQFNLETCKFDWTSPCTPDNPRLHAFLANFYFVLHKQPSSVEKHYQNEFQKVAKVTLLRRARISSQVPKGWFRVHPKTDNPCILLVIVNTEGLCCRDQELCAFRRMPIKLVETWGLGSCLAKNDVRVTRAEQQPRMKKVVIWSLASESSCCLEC